MPAAGVQCPAKSRAYPRRGITRLACGKRNPGRPQTDVVVTEWAYEFRPGWEARQQTTGGQVLRLASYPGGRSSSLRPVMRPVPNSMSVQTCELNHRSCDLHGPLFFKVIHAGLAQPSIDSLEAAVTSLTSQLTQIKAESAVLKRRAEVSEAENAALKQEMAAGVLTDAQAAQVQKITEAILGKSQGPSAS
jgi:hypothetical protein